MTRSEFEVELRRWFKADDLPDSEVDRLYGIWQERGTHWPYRHWLGDQFDSSNQAADGAAWWEKRQQGERGKVLPITEIDLARMWLHSDPRAGSPEARPWCPEVLVGRWHLVGVRNDRNEEWRPPAARREWTLYPDGRFDVVGDPRHQGWSWAAQWSGKNLDLRLHPPGNPLPAIRPTYFREGGDIDVFMSNEDPCHLLWRREP